MKHRQNKMFSDENKSSGNEIIRNTTNHNT